MRAVLETTGVVSGEFGFANAFKGKKEAIQIWNDDADPKIRAFASDYAAAMDRRIGLERRQVEQEITARKHRYGNSE